jgi:hypothetical protein
MKQILFILASGMFFITACQKDLTFENTGTPNPGGGGTGGGGGNTFELLLKASAKRSATDSSVTEYTYNAAKQVTGIFIKDVSAASGTITNWFKFKRDASGKTTQLVQSFTSFIPGGPDSIVINVFYQPGTTRFIYSKYEISLAGFAFTDSTVYTYDASNRIIQAESFQSSPLTGVYEKLEKTEYTYDASSNVKGSKTYSWDDVNSVYDLDLTEVNEFDGKVQPVIMGNECFINGSNYQYFSKNNTTKQVLDYLTAVPPGKITSVATFTYNTANKPATGTATLTGLQTGNWNAVFTYN